MSAPGFPAWNEVNTDNNQQCSQTMSSDDNSNQFTRNTTRRRWLPVKARQDGRPRRRSVDFNYVRYRSTLLTINDDQTKWLPTVYYHFTTTDDSILLSALHCYTLYRSLLFSCQTSTEVSCLVSSLKYSSGSVPSLHSALCRKSCKVCREVCRLAGVQVRTPPGGVSA